MYVFTSQIITIFAVNIFEAYSEIVYKKYTIVGTIVVVALYLNSNTRIETIKRFTFPNIWESQFI